MKIALISVSGDIMNFGIRRLARYMRLNGHHTRVIYMPTINYASIRQRLFPSFGGGYTEESLAALSEMLKDCDLVGFSSMTSYASKVKSIILSIRERLPKCIILWGGIHPTVFPDDAIEYADIICRGEGEFALLELVDALEKDRDLKTIRNMWLKTSKSVVKNQVRALLTDAELDQLPYMDYGIKDNFILCGSQIRPLKKEDYIDYFGSNYYAMYTLGCPFRCSYCSNDLFIKLNPDYQLIRKPSVGHIIGELKSVLSIHPYIRSIIFADDAFFFLKLEAMQEFTSLYKKEVGLPFSVLGANPITVTEEKMELLVAAGLNRVRMGIQSGSIETLKTYNRKTSPETIINASKIIAKYKNKLMLPTYDIIIDNPYESLDNLLETIYLLDRLHPPFTLNVFSLRFLPGTALAEKAFQDGIDDSKKGNQMHLKASKFTYANLIICAFSIFKIPHRLLKILVTNKRFQSDKEYFVMGKLLYWLMLFRRGVNHLTHNDFSLFTGKFFCYISQVFKRANRNSSIKIRHLH